MWRTRTQSLLYQRQFFSTSEKTPSLYSFLQPSIFSLKANPSSKPINLPVQTPKTLTQDQIDALVTNLHSSLSSNNTDEAWKSFKTLTNSSNFPSKQLTNYLICYLSMLNDAHNLKRAFASVVYVIEKQPQLLDFKTVNTLLNCMYDAGTFAPAFALIRCLFKNRFFLPFSVWGNIVVQICRKSGSFGPFLKVFEENCRIAIDEKLDFIKPDLVACNAALEGCCCELESVSDAEKVVETMTVFGVQPDESSFGFLAYLYALRGLEEKIVELENLMSAFGISDRRVFYSNLICGYVKSGNLASVSATILRCLRERDGQDLNFGQETYITLVKGFLQNGSIKDVASLITEAQKLECPSLTADKSIGFAIVNSCVHLGFLDKAHSILDEMNATGCMVGLGVYVSILKAYCKEHRTAEAAELVMDVSSSGLQLDASLYDALIEASMSSQDFQSAFSIFRDMREARTPDVKASYLTIMTGLTEHHRPELMAAFLDEVVEDPRIEVGNHDWNSIIHAFCKVGRLEDARRTFRRMTFLQFEPNDQTYLSLINGYATAGKYFSILMLWNEIKRKISTDREKGVQFDHTLVDAFLYTLVKGGFFDAVMQVVEKSQEKKIFVDKWRYKQAFMETHKKLKVAKLRKRNFRKMEALIAFKNWAGLIKNETPSKSLNFKSYSLHISTCYICLSYNLPVAISLTMPKTSAMSQFLYLWMLISMHLPPFSYSISDLVHLNPTNGTCLSNCGFISVKFPFGTGFGCGHPDFSRYIKCSSGSLQLSTSSGIYTVSSIDYTSNTLVVTDPLMSTCTSMQNSGSFSLDQASPFTIMSGNIFVLLGCSTTSPVFDPNEDLCDTGSGSRVCQGLYSCKGVTGIGLETNAPVSTCCVYESPVGIGPGYTLDLPKLQCSSYSSIYGFGENERDPAKWNFGISLQFNGSYDSNACKDCEASGGLCGFANSDESFACICQNGMNTTNNCFGRGYAWSGAWRPNPQIMISMKGVLVSWMVLLLGSW
ncbi:Pentatricopeptide repeat [Dillenia turbinata]|uniref:non-specific serine/threonine protein kinase n=1 Tax=Dillenia turbinata TaxID=194707 RepID=A0AAN8UWB1_9MAGN